MLKKNQKVKVHQKDSTMKPGIISFVEEKKGFRRQYPYQQVDVEFLDGTVEKYRDFDCVVMDKSDIPS